MRFQSNEDLSNKEPTLFANMLFAAVLLSASSLLFGYVIKNTMIVDSHLKQRCCEELLVPCITMSCFALPRFNDK
ncbi:hypothetical protein KUL152_01030 [Tenacibaculum sp. KUL152]|nr:hypothetical protein KUL152_01030 [Tenacibaculum sp. KUL152]